MLRISLIALNFVGEFVGGYLVNKYFKHGNECVHVCGFSLHKQRNSITSTQISLKVHTFSTFMVAFLCQPLRRGFGHISHILLDTNATFFGSAVKSTVFVLFAVEKNTNTHTHTKKPYVYRNWQGVKCSCLQYFLNHTLATFHMCDAQWKWNVMHRSFVQFGHHHSVWQYSLPLTLTLNTIIRISLSGVLCCALKIMLHDCNWFRIDTVIFRISHFLWQTNRVRCGTVHTLLCHSLYFNAVCWMLMLMFFGVVHSAFLVTFFFYFVENEWEMPGSVLRRTIETGDSCMVSADCHHHHHGPMNLERAKFSHYAHAHCTHACLLSDLSEWIHFSFWWPSIACNTWVCVAQLMVHGLMWILFNSMKFRTVHQNWDLFGIRIKLQFCIRFFGFGLFSVAFRAVSDSVDLVMYIVTTIDTLHCVWSENFDSNATIVIVNSQFSTKRFASRISLLLKLSITPMKTCYFWKMWFPCGWSNEDLLWSIHCCRPVVWMILQQSAAQDWQIKIDI